MQHNGQVDDEQSDAQHGPEAQAEHVEHFGHYQLVTFLTGHVQTNVNLIQMIGALQMALYQLSSDLVGQVGILFHQVPFKLIITSKHYGGSNVIGTGQHRIVHQIDNVYSLELFQLIAVIVLEHQVEYAEHDGARVEQLFCCNPRGAQRVESVQRSTRPVALVGHRGQCGQGGVLPTNLITSHSEAHCTGHVHVDQNACRHPMMVDYLPAEEQIVRKLPIRCWLS